jgi:hypothetical protein
MLVGRTEHRGHVSFVARLQRHGAPLESAAVSVENISSHGARVVTTSPLAVHERLVLGTLLGDFSVDAEVVYCERLSPTRCAIGLRFSTAVDDE